jgi:integrase/recombinase XerD
MSDRNLGEQFRAVADRIDTLYAPDTLGETDQMRRLRLEHSRLLGNGWCTRPKQMDCQFESVCEGCGFFATTVEFKPTLTRQRDHAAQHDQPQRVAVFQELLDGLDQNAS